jgi:hypothetical protein
MLHLEDLHLTRSRPYDFALHYIFNFTCTYYYNNVVILLMTNSVHAFTYDN